LGVQTTTSSSTYLSTATTRFIPTTAIQDIFIHEAFKNFEVRFYLAIVVEGEEDAVVVFPVCLNQIIGTNNRFTNNYLESTPWSSHS
jgi:phosphatidylinositol N-acetylglucosaminyltransferase subunit H